MAPRRLSNCQVAETFHPAALSATKSASTTLGVTNADMISGVSMDLEKVARGVQLILEGIGEDSQREGLLETPSRVARMYQEMLYGTNLDPAMEITCTFNEDNEELILVRDIPFASMCEHHLVPFVGVAHVGYVPDGGRITGLSKLARVVELAARRLQVQERLTTQIANALVSELKPLGVAVVLEAEHFCMSVRGVNKPGAKTITSALRGIFQTNKASRAEVMTLIQGRVM